MPVYFGIPVSCKEAFRIFGLDIESVKNRLIERGIKKSWISDCYFIEDLNKHLETYPVKIQVYSTDKGQNIIGYEVEEPSNVWSKFINVDDFVTLLIQLKVKFSEEMATIGADLSEVTLEYMEGDDENPEKVKNPSPYIISYTN